MIGTIVVTAEPFLRWAGGKRWLAQHIAPMIRARLVGTYREPFLGGGSMFFAVQPSRAVVSDLNCDLISAWRAVEINPERLLAEIRRLPVNADTYYRIRDLTPDSPLTRAVRFIYLNRCCYGGLYRTNRQGHFNVPYGGGSRTPAPLWERDQIFRASRMLQNCQLTLCEEDFASAMDRAEAGDFCFLDPTYTTVRRGPFDRYNAKLFTWDDQLRLHAAAHAAAQRGVVIVMCNVDCEEIRALYRQQLTIFLDRSKAIGNPSKAFHAGRELLIIFDAPRWRENWISAATEIVRRSKALVRKRAETGPLALELDGALIASVGHLD